MTEIQEMRRRHLERVAEVAAGEATPKVFQGDPTFKVMVQEVRADRLLQAKDAE